MKISDMLLPAAAFCISTNKFKKKTVRVCCCCSYYDFEHWRYDDDDVDDGQSRCFFFHIDCVMLVSGVSGFVVDTLSFSYI